MDLELSDADFDAYAAERTRATAMTPPRSAVKKRLVAWMREIGERLSSEGIELEVSATDEHPSARNGHRVDAQSAFLYRNDGARETMHRVLGAAGRTPAAQEDDRLELGNARIEVRVDANAVSLVLRLGGDARADLEHAAAMLAIESDEVLASWERLPAGIAIEARASITQRARSLRDMTPRDASQIAKQALESEVPLVLGVRVARDDATRRHALDAWSDIAFALAELMDTIEWTPDTAAIVAARVAERPSRRGKRIRVKEPTPPPPEPAPKSLIDRGAHVRALAGPFAGQAGVVQELDGKGAARVLFGALVARVELRDLTVKSKKPGGRPVLSSSHRKPT